MYLTELCETKNFQAAEPVDLQGHRWCHLIGHIRFPISLPLQLCLYIAVFPRYCHVFPKFKDVTSLPGTHPFWT